ncbi:MAG: phosphoribosyl-ATP diphosphatase [Alphaproteobacteria bacterium]|nr:phosphoribosyl-ATP diphosphatase [Alphaproteobacteria bacterium]
MSRIAQVLDRLAAVISARAGSDPGASWTARLLADPVLAAKKVIEEAGETALAAAGGEREALPREAADLLYHLLVLLAAHRVTLDEVAAVLESREGTSGVAEKASRTDRP